MPMDTTFDLLQTAINWATGVTWSLNPSACAHGFWQRRFCQLVDRPFWAV